MPRLLSPAGWNKERETNDHLLLKVMDPKLYRTHAVEFFLVNDARIMEGLHDFHSRRVLNLRLQLCLLSVLELANEALFV